MFLITALSSDSGTDAAAGGAVRASSRWGDYFDGLAARLTGQYSRLGALMDPVIDRLLVICGVIVCWKFDLLAALAARDPGRPRAVHARRRAARAAPRRASCGSTTLGRLAVGPVMLSLFFGLVGWSTAGNVALLTSVC